VREDPACAICGPGIVSLIKRISRCETTATMATNDGDADHRELKLREANANERTNGSTRRTKRRKRLTGLTDVAGDNKVGGAMVTWYRPAERVTKRRLQSWGGWNHVGKTE